MRPVQHDDLLKFKFLSRPAFSPDGGKIAYVVSSANFDKNDYDSALWLYDLAADSGRQLTFTNSEKFFAWSRDGRELIFASGRGDVPKDSTRFYALPLDGGEARELFTIDRPASAIADLGGGRWLVTATFEPVYDNPEGADYYVIEQLPFTANGKGFVCQRRTGLAVYDAASGGFTRVTPEHMEVARCHLSDDGRKALLVAVEYTDVKPTTNHVYELDLGTGELSCLSEGLTFGFKDAGWYKDGALVTGSDQKTVGVNQNIQFFFLKGKKLDAVTPDLDSSLRNAVGSDCRYNTADQEGGFAVEGGRVIYCATEGFRSRLYALEADGSISALTNGTDTVDNWDWKDGKAVMAGFKGLQLQELYLLENGRERQLTRHNEDVIKELQLSAPEHVSCENEGWQLDGWYMKPIGCEEGRKYPTILHIHGGPKSAFGGVYFHEMQCWASRGYAVIYCNPRGGDGRPGGFDDIRGFYGVKDYSDIMAFTKWCVANLPFVDEKNVGVTGGSYGGYMTNWIVTQTDFFKAAAAQRPISNWVSKFGSCDIGYYYVEDQHGGRPWDACEQAWQESPLKHVANVKTPLLLIQSQEDFRCERDQSFQMFTALKVLGVECRMCLFNGENHELSRSGRPKNRLARLREIAAWFDGHLKG
ncbi:S9 family peptidase [Pyramidobacter piscolens]|uniref:S9 family peptidase n=1 Tax=Pyramidobacter piscolens TaxID=638849 RepID=UPI0026653723|nr:S9 family peptidase [Pyramidobacter piscolens]